MRLEDFDYELPQELIAQEPAAERDRARLFVHHVAEDRSAHREVRDLGEFLRPGDVLVLNDTRVLAARLFGRRASGGRVELLLLEPLEGDEWTWKALVHPARRLREGERLELEDRSCFVRMLARPRLAEDRPAMEWPVQLEDAAGARLDPRLVLERIGHVPLPPYLGREDRAQDAERYQTVYAARPGAVAAPTAGLHFTPELLRRLEQQGVRRATLTLHVGPGTFQPVKAQRVEEHVMHAERYELPAATVETIRAARAAGGRVLAVGTTVVRVLESSVDERGDLLPGAGSTRLFLVPGARFRWVDALLTNFHLPRSTLLMLVCAFAGRERVLRLYREAIELRYRFYSYGDALLLL